MSVGVALAVSSSPASALSGPAPSLLLFDPSLSAVERLGLQTRFAATPLHDLGLDLVRGWRDGLGRLVLGNPHSVALARWSGAQVLTGLVREAGGRASMVQVGKDTFEVVIESPEVSRAAPVNLQDRSLQES